MITHVEPLSIAEVKELIKKLPESEKVKRLDSYVKKFCKGSIGDALKLKKELQESFPGISAENIVKIMDIMPKDADDARKILSESGVEENEIVKILEIVKKYI
ncbi:MAG: hypothetical protein V1886_02730 [archaeon]